MAVSLHRGDDFDRHADGNLKVTASLTLRCTYNPYYNRSAAVSRSALNSTRRTVSNFPPKVATFKEAWLSDVTTYPIMGIIVAAVTGAFTFIGYKVMYGPDVRITSKCKGKVIRTWS